MSLPRILVSVIRVGVDDLFFAKGDWWCHLICDDFSPQGIRFLHDFALRLGVPRRAFHDPAGQPRPHYDLRPAYRELALEQGAEPLTRYDLVAFLQRGRARLQILPVPEQ